MCTAWLDSANGVAHHLAQNLDFAVVAAADLRTLRAPRARARMDKLRLLSAGSNTFKYDLGSERQRGRSGLNHFRFTRERHGTVRHAYSVHPRMAADIQERGIDCTRLSGTTWTLLRRAGAIGAASLAYGTKVQGAST